MRHRRLSALLLCSSVFPLPCLAAGPEESCAAAEDETSLLHLTTLVNQRGSKNKLSGTAVASGPGAIAAKQPHSQVAPQLIPTPSAGGAAVAARSPPLPPPAAGSSLLQLLTSTLSHSQLHAAIQQSARQGDALSSVSEGGSAFASTTQAHMLAYVVLFGICMVLMGFGMLVIVGMKKEDDAPDQQQDVRPHAGADLRPTSTLPPSSGNLVPSSGAAQKGFQETAPGGLYQRAREAVTGRLTKTQPLLGPAATHPPRGPSATLDHGTGGDPLDTMRGNPIHHSIGSSGAPGTGELCPELAGATVPDKSKFPMRVPMLLHANAEDAEHAITRTVQAKDGTPMFNLKITRRKALPNETNHPEEYIRLSLPEEDHRELVLCAFGRPFGKLECHIYQLGKDPWGIIRENAEGSYSIFLRDTNPSLTAVVTGSDSNRRVKITQSQTQTDVAVATVKTDGGPGNEYYEVDCYPFCDIILTIIMITGADRLSVNSHK